MSTVVPIVMSSATTLTIRVVNAPSLEGAGIRVEIRCAVCGRVVPAGDGLYTVQATLGDDESAVRGVVRSADGRQWAFSSGAELATVVKLLGHSHSEED